MFMFRLLEIEEHEEVCNTLNVKEDLSCKEELATVIKRLKNNKTPGADSVVNEFLRYGGSEVIRMSVVIIEALVWSL